MALRHDFVVFDYLFCPYSKGVIEKAMGVGEQLGMGSSQPRLHFDRGDVVLFEVLKGSITEWAWHPQCILVPG